MNPQSMNPLAKQLSDLVKQYRALGHSSDEAIKMAEATVRLVVESGPKMITDLKAVAREALDAATARLHSGLAEVDAIRLKAYEQIKTGPQEVIHLAMLWVWDSARAAGPRCPEHKTPLLYQTLANGNPLGVGIAEYGDTVPTRHPNTGETIEAPRFLGPNGTFRCPTDGLLWPQIGTWGAQLAEIRAQATALLKHKIGTAPVGETP